MDHIKFEKFDLVKHADVEVGRYKCTCPYYSELDKIAAAAAKEFDGPCIAIKDDGRIIAISCAKGCARRKVIFNAAKSEEKSECRITVRNSGKGALTDFWFSQYITPEQGKYV